MPSPVLTHAFRQALSRPPALPAVAPPAGGHRAALRQDVPRAPAGTPLVTVIILNRNGAGLLDALFASLKAHETWPALEIVLVDHASTDDSRAVAARWAAELPLRVVACTENHSFSYSNNRAAETAAGEFLFLLNNDIVFTGPVIGRMVAAVQATGGLVGVRQYENEPPGPDGTRPWHHIGVRFFWNPIRRFIVPRNAAPQPGDEEIAQGVADLPAVTGSMMLCRRDDYLAVGGLHEGYFYGYEDIDLCCLFRHRLGRPVLALNDIAALHGDGRTRKKAGTTKERRAIHRANIRCLDDRWGFVLWRALGPAWLDDDGSLRGAPPVLAVVAGAEAGAGGHDLPGWRTAGAVPRLGPLDLRGVDVAVTADPGFRWGRVWLAEPTLVRVGWTVGATDRWLRRRDLAGYDLLVAGDGDAAAALRAAGAPRVALAGDDLRRAVVASRRDGLRLALAGPRRAARRLALALGRLGVTARPTGGRSALDVDSADVVIRLGAAEILAAARPVVAVDAATAPDAVIAAARAAVDRCGRAPVDAPLPNSTPPAWGRGAEC
ncbi:glycosyltransferase family 2 protein [Novispirillum sp. DQ9]|uniref:glycosyltransferase family 2 protein n=1 Tax=Novispirillum sp. DQ9 TaxID=3398612 RepID=UPI003C7AD81F